MPLDPAGALQDCTMDSLQILLLWRIDLDGTIRMDMDRHSITLVRRKPYFVFNAVVPYWKLLRGIRQSPCLGQHE